MKNYQVTEIELYLSEVGDGDPDLQFTPEEEYVCLLYTSPSPRDS
mgnify:CR=1 FL=1